MPTGDGSGKPLLTLRVDAGPDSGPGNLVPRSGLEVPERWQRMEVPAGGVVPTMVSAGATTVRLACPDGTYRGDPVGSLEVTATAAYTGLWSYAAALRARTSAAGWRPSRSAPPTRRRHGSWAVPPAPRPSRAGSRPSRRSARQRGRRAPAPGTPT
ncbi:hypothetical protein ACIHAR_37010 [Streptomyces sp. NPDC052016]|uniref:hypothetical protein n=1 Tax=Streptomyces sp. NPDC052016 TaxID=3365680 RepID=UPI0037D45AD3